MNAKCVAALLGATMLGTSAWAQETDEIIVLSSPFKKAATDVISTTEILTAEDLQAQIDGPLGNVLDVLPGVSSAGYGPAVGQPVIRGLGGYRVDTMTNGMTIGDISSTSGDHTNVMSLFDTERVEVLKGPAALRYGAYAATGVVNGFNRHLNADTEEGTDVSFSFVTMPMKPSPHSSPAKVSSACQPSRKMPRISPFRHMQKVIGKWRLSKNMQKKKGRLFRHILSMGKQKPKTRRANPPVSTLPVISATMKRISRPC